MTCEFNLHAEASPSNAHVAEPVCVCILESTSHSKHHACHCLPMGSTDVAHQSGGVEATSNLMTEGQWMN